MIKAVVGGMPPAVTAVLHVRRDIVPVEDEQLGERKIRLNMQKKTKFFLAFSVCKEACKRDMDHNIKDRWMDRCRGTMDVASPSHLLQ